MPLIDPNIISQAQQALLNRAATRQGAQGKPLGKPAGMGPYGNDYAQKQAAEAQDWWKQEVQRRQMAQQNDLIAADPAEYGIPDNWDYNNPDKLGPHGETLPEGAVGWDAHGRPYYGGQSALGEWWKALTAKLGATTPQPVDMQAIPGFGYIPLKAAKGPELLKVEGETKQIEGNVRGMVNPTATVPKITGGIIEGTGEVIKAIMALAGTPAQVAEQAAGLVIKPEQGKKGELQVPTQMGARGGMIPARYAPADFTRPVVSIPRGKTWDETKQLINERWNAGRIFYSTVFDVAKYNEYVQRYQAGENPYLLQQELENPLAEAVGQAIFDPLNLIGVGAGERMAAGRLLKAQERFYNLVPELQDVVRVGEQGVQVLGNDAQVAEAIGKFVGRVGEGVTRSAKDYGILAATVGGKRYAWSRETAEFLNFVVRTAAQSPDEAGQIMINMAKMASPNEAERAAGFAMLRNVNAPRPFLSEAGMTTAYFLRQMMGETKEGLVDAGGFLKSIENAWGDLEKAAKLEGKAVSQTDKAVKALDIVRRKMEGVAETLFPDIKTFIKTEETAGRPVSWTLKTKAALLEGKVRKGFTTVQNGFNLMYLSANPGYAFRNGFNNWFTMFVDDPANLSRTPTQALAAINGWSKGNIPQGVGGFTATKGLEMKKAIGTAKMAEAEEYNSSLKVIAEAMDKTMRQALRPGLAIPDMSGLVAQGMSQDTANWLVREIIDNYGDVDGAVGKLLESITTGSVSNTHILAINEVNEKYLRDYNLFTEAQALIKDAKARGATPQEFATEFDAWWEGKKANIISQAGIDKQVAAISEDAVYGPEGEKITDALAQAQQDGALDDLGREAATHLYQANSNAIQSATDVLTGPEGLAGLKAQANELFKQSGDATALSKLTELETQQVAPLMADLRKVTDETAQFRARWLDWPNTYNDWLVQHGQGKDNLELWWSMIRKATEDLHGGNTLPVEAPQTWDEFRHAFWTQFFFPEQMGRWNDFRNAYSKAAADIWQEAIKILPPANGEAAPLKGLLADMEVARTLETAQPYYTTRFAINDLLAKGDQLGAVREFAKGFNLTPGDLPDEELLRIVNEIRTARKETPLTDLGSVYYSEGAEAVVRWAQQNPVIAPESVAKAVEVAPEVAAAAPQLRNMDEAQMQAMGFEIDYKEDPLTGTDAWIITDKKGQTILASRKSREDALDEAQKFLDRIYKGRAERVAAAKAPEVAAVEKAITPEENTARIERMRTLFGSRTDLAEKLDVSPQDAEYINETIIREAETMRSELRGGTGPVRGKTKEGEVFKLPTTNVAWYRDIYAKGGGRKAVEGALKRIIEGNDKITGNQKTIEMIKDELINRILGWSPQQTMEYPGDPRILLALGFEDEAAASFGKHLEDMDLTAEQMVKLAGSKENSDWLLARWMDIQEGAKTEFPAPRYVKPIAPYAGNTPTNVRPSVEGLRTGDLDRIVGEVKQAAVTGWDSAAPVTSNPQMEAALKTWAKQATGRIDEWRLVSAQVGNLTRDFTLLSYPEKRNIDLLLAYIYPYHFWYGRTYVNWMKRIVNNPSIVSHYAQYKEALAKIHAGAPAWWKYNIKINVPFSVPFLGIDPQHPLFFNLEQTLNPLNGVTGIDFTDPEKRGEWWAKTVDDAGKLGPSLWTPWNWVVAAGLYAKGEQEAGSRWMGRLIPQTATLKTLTAVTGLNKKGGAELDPFVNFFQGGADSYERNRIGRALGWMIDNGEITQAQGDDAARTSSGPIWDEAAARATRLRSAGQLASFFFGTGFKARGPEDVQIDRFFEDYNQFWNSADLLSPEEWKNGMNQLQAKYPFMDTVLISRKHGLDRDRSYIYNVMSRIPPGQKSDILGLFGVDEKSLNAFYDNKGDLTKLNEVTKQKLLTAAIDIGAVLEMPDNATRQEWTQAGNSYQEMLAEMNSRFGADIQDKINMFLDGKSENYMENQANNQLLDKYPEIQEAMDFRTAYITNDPRLSQYYGSYQKVESYYKGLMFDALHREVGDDIQQTIDAYSDFAIRGDTKGQAKFKKQHPELSKYWELKSLYEKLIAKAVMRVGQALQSPKYPALRPDLQNATPEQQQLQDLIQGGQSQLPPEYSYTWEELSSQMSPSLQNVVKDYVYSGKKLSRGAEDQLDYLAGKMGIDPSIMLDLISNSLR